MHYFLLCYILLIYSAKGDEDKCQSGEISSKRFLLYNVNPGEGFNLRRDVYLRVANLVRHLNEHEHWILVLPPWTGFYHWKNTPHGVIFPWRNFFNITSLRKWIPVIEMQTYIKENGANIDSAYILQHYAEGWQGRYEDKYDKRDCIERNSFRQDSSDGWNAFMWGRDFKCKRFDCLSYQGSASKIIPLLMKNESQSRSVFLGRAEVLLHDTYGGHEYWAARRSMQFASNLVKEATRFRKEFLDSSDDVDKTVRSDDWRNFKPKSGSALGGSYLSVHMRRRDFVKARPGEVPSIASAAKQLKKLLKKYGLKKVFVATDAPSSEINELESLLKDYDVFQYIPTKSFLEDFGDGAVAIVDQIICSHARFFIGTHESTFSFRIQEEREILGFSPETTFNRLCGSGSKCEPPSKWTIVYH